MSEIRRIDAAVERQLQVKIKFARYWNRGYIALAIWSIVTAALAPAIQAAEEPLSMGVFPRRNSAETAMAFTPMADYLGKRLGRTVKVITSKNFDAFWKAVTEQRYDIVLYNQYHYIRSAQTYQVVAHIEELGKSTIAAVIYVRKDSGIATLAQLRGRTIMFGGGEDAMISYIANRYLFLQAGLGKDDFKSLFAVNPPNAIVALMHRQADAAGAGDSVLDLPEVRNAIDADELTALAVSAPLLQLPVAVKRAMPAKLRTSIQSILVELKNSEGGRQVLKSAALTGMGKSEDKDYDPHRKMATAVFGPTGMANKQFARGHESAGAAYRPGK
jgi:phosphonate transport system substrate-binding protein